MSYCLNPQCPNPQNPMDSKFCLTCGAKLLLKDRYRAIKLIGHGGFGKTFLAVDEDKPSKPPCVIKQFFPQSYGTNNTQKAAELFHREAERLDQLGQHSQIPELLAHFEQDGNQYLVQEFIDGENLAEELATHGVFNEISIQQLLDDLLPVLQFIHQHRVIHRDIKPANIIRRGSSPSQLPPVPGQLVLVDFGAAKVVTTSQLPAMGTIIGSPEYIAPEQIRGQAVYASDIYSLGVTCIHLLTDISPFDLFDIHEDRWVWRDYLKGKPVSDSLGRILDKMLASTPNQRYATPLQVLKDLHPQGIPAGLLHHIQVTPTPVPAPTVSPTQPPQSIVGTQLQPQRLTPLRSSPTWTCRYTLTGHHNGVTAVVFSPDGEILASGSQDQTIEIWRLQGGKRWYTLTGHTNWITSLAFSRDSQLLASGSRDKTIEIWDMAKGKRWYTLAGHGDGVETIAFSPDGQRLASGSRDKTIEIWDMAKGKRWYSLLGHTDRVYGVAFSGDSQILASGSRDRTVRLWDLKKAKEIQMLTGHTDWITTVAFSPNSEHQQLASGSRDGMIKLWQLENGRWELQRTLRADQGDVFAIAWSPDGQTLVSGSRQGTLDFWDTSKGILLETLNAHSQDILTVAFSSDGQYLASGSSDRTVKIWQGKK